MASDYKVKLDSGFIKNKITIVVNGCEIVIVPKCDGFKISEVTGGNLVVRPIANNAIQVDVEQFKMND